MRKSRTFCIILSVVIPPFFFGCSPDISDDPIPFAAFPPVTINLNLPEYQYLRTRGYVEQNDIGVRGVMIVMVNASTYHAYERNCSYRPAEACATVTVHPSTLYMIDDCCSSTFELATGNPINGPAWRPLRRYVTSLSGHLLTITDDIVQ